MAFDRTSDNTLPGCSVASHSFAFASASSSAPSSLGLVDPVLVGVHSGEFHADDAFAIATLRRYYEDAIEVVRTRDEQTLTACHLRVDVGGRHDPQSGDFDHHQTDGAGERANGIRHAAFGLVWQHYGKIICGSQEIADEVDRKLVQAIDAGDVGQKLCEPVFEDARPFGVDRLISSLNPTWDEPSDEGERLRRFVQAVELAQTTLDGAIRTAAAVASAREHVRAAVEQAADPRVVVLQRGMPWRETLVKEAPQALLVVYPSTSGDWGVQCVPQRIGEFANRRDLPAAWAGLRGEQLAQATGIADAFFCHNGLFFACARTPEGALALARAALVA